MFPAGGMGKYGKTFEDMQRKLQKLDADLKERVVEAAAGGGMVKVKVNGHMEVQKCVLSDEAVKLNDKELLEDLIAAACNQAIQKARTQVAEETSKVATGLGVPAGMNFPGLGT